MNTFNVSKKNTIICDVDGTILLDDHRRPLIPLKGPEAYFQACSGDDPHFPVIAVLRMFRKMGMRIVMITGRSENVRQKTLDSFRQWDIPCDELHMCKTTEYDETSFAPGGEIKGRIIREQNIKSEDVLCVLEDRNEVVEWWREQGFDCWQVRGEGEIF